VTAIAEVTGFDRKTVRKLPGHPDLEPRYKPRRGRPTLLDPLKSYTFTSGWRRAFGTPSY
jgi:transposase